MSLFDFLKELVFTTASSIGVILILLKMGKGALQKIIEKVIESTAEKSIAKYTNTLQRRTSAYELLLNKEFSYYDSISKSVSTIIISVQEFSLYLTLTDSFHDDFSQNKARELAISIAETLLILRRDCLMYQLYIPAHIKDTSYEIMDSLQSYIPISTKSYHALIDGSFSSEILSDVRQHENDVLSKCEKLNVLIKNRLEELSKE